MTTKSSGSSQDEVSLRTRLQERGALSLEEASVLLDNIAEILDGAAKRGLEHGTLSPENVILLPDGGVRLHDAAEEPSSPNLISIGYLSPEEARQEPPTHETDIWALGSLLYEMLTCHAPFASQHRPTLARLVQNEEPKPLSQELAVVQPMIDRAMAKWPANRYHSAQQMANDFWEALPHPPSDGSRLLRSVPPPGPGGQALRRLHEAADRSLRLGPKEQQIARPRGFFQRFFSDKRSV